LYECRIVLYLQCVIGIRAIFVMKMKTRITALRSASTKTRIMTICEMKTI